MERIGLSAPHLRTNENTPSTRHRVLVIWPPPALSSVFLPTCLREEVLIGLVQKQGSGKLVLARTWLQTSRGTWSWLFLALVSPSAPGAGGQIPPITLPVLNSYVLAHSSPEPLGGGFLELCFLISQWDHHPPLPGLRSLMKGKQVYPLGEGSPLRYVSSGTLLGLPESHTWNLWL